jgi:hypothetical protein
MRKILVGILFTGIQLYSFAQDPALHINWDQKIIVSRSTPTLQVVVNPLLRPGSPIHDGSFGAVKQLGADMVRYALWFPYPKLVVAELEPPDGKKTSWDFSLIDPMTIDFMKATEGHPAIMEFCTIPEWMLKTAQPIKYAANPDSVDWGYMGGAELRDTTLKEISDYFARVVSWYHNGGFTDELGKYHKSGYHYAIPYWEVLNEPGYLSVEKYTKMYDAVVKAIRKVSPETKFIGLALADITTPHLFEYFLNPANHEPGIPLDMISYHFYAAAPASESFEVRPYVYFNNTDGFLNCVRYIEAIRKSLSPGTKVDLDELGTFLSSPISHSQDNIPPMYWNISASVYAYMFIELSKMGIDVIGESQLVGYPSQFPDVSMMDWTNGKPNARYWALKLIKDNFAPGDIMVQTNVGSIWVAEEDYTAQGYITKRGKKILLLNKKDKTFNIKMPPEFKGGKLYTVDMASGENEPVQSTIADSVQLKPFAVAVALAH